MIRSVSQTLYKPTEEVTLKLSVGLLDSKSDNRFINVWDTQTGKYLNFDTTTANVILQYKPKGSIFDRSRNLYISSKNIMHWNLELTKFYNTMQKPEIFKYYKSGAVECLDSETYKHTISLTGNQWVELEPCVIFTNDGSGTIPGITIRINTSDNAFDLSMDEFESIYYIFKTINIPRDAMQLLLGRLIVDNKMKLQLSTTLPDIQQAAVPVTNEPQKTYNYRGSLFDGKEGVLDKRTLPSATESIKSIDDI